MKKILYVYGNLPAYRNKFFTKLSECLVGDGVSLAVMHGSPTNKKEVRQDTLNTYKRFSFISKSTNLFFFSLIHIPGLVKTFKKEKPDAMILSFSSTQMSMLRLVFYCLLHKIPYATWRCGYNNDDYSKPIAMIRESIITFVEKKAQYCIAYGSYYKQILINKGISSDKIVIAQNTIDVESIVDDNKDLDRNYEEDVTKVLFVGALIKKKYLETSIEAIEQLYKEGYKIRFDIIGGGEMLEPLKQFVRTKGIEDVINVVGPKYGDEVKQYFRNHHLFLAAGLGGLAINEAMAYGLPIISTNADWTICDLIDGNGFFMESYGNVKLQVKYLKLFMQLSPEEKASMSLRSQTIIMEKASLSNMIAKHRDVCIKLLSN